MASFSFSIEKNDAGARAGMITTAHGTVPTPAFVPVGTKGTIKGILPKDLREIAGADVVLGNTYHLFLQPGEDVVKGAGGLHSFMGWQGPLFTDSGGFQVFSLGVGFGKGVSKFSPGIPEKGENGRVPSVFDEEILTQHGKLAIVDDEGVSFTSHIDGTLHRFTPERSIEIQHKLGADMFFAFDEFRPPSAAHEEHQEAMDRTHRWAERSLKAHRTNIDAQSKQAIFGIVQGGRHLDLRKKSSEVIGSLPFDGFGIGGAFSKDDLGEALSSGISGLPRDMPRHLLGIGEPEDILEGIAHGMDTFDCVLPTRLGRTGAIYTARGKVNLFNEKYIRDFSPLDTETGGYASDTFTKAYLAHLFRAKEMLAAQIATLHNLYFFIKMTKDARNAILEGRFAAFREDFLTRYQAS